MAIPRFKLLTAGNPKTAKGAKLGYWTFILHLAPADLSGYEVCPMRSKGCTKACLNVAGRGGITSGKGLLSYDELIAGNGRTNAIQKARVRKTKLYFEDRAAFMALLRADIARAVAIAKREGFIPVFRLNGTSDIRWELSGIMQEFSDVQFYDYTKIANRKNIPANYALTFSLADGNDAMAETALANGLNVAAVFRNKDVVARYEASGFMGRTVFNGDDTDLRFLDPRGVVVALYAKGQARKDNSGFVRD
jgi:hypothetical protein